LGELPDGVRSTDAGQMGGAMPIQEDAYLIQKIGKRLCLRNTESTRERESPDTIKARQGEKGLSGTEKGVLTLRGKEVGGSFEGRDLIDIRLRKSVGGGGNCDMKEINMEKS